MTQGDQPKRGQIGERLSYQMKAAEWMHVELMRLSEYELRLIVAYFMGAFPNETLAATEAMPSVEAFRKAVWEARGA